MELVPFFLGAHVLDQPLNCGSGNAAGYSKSSIYKTQVSNNKHDYDSGKGAGISSSVLEWGPKGGIGLVQLEKPYALHGATRTDGYFMHSENYDYQALFPIRICNAPCTY